MDKTICINLTNVVSETCNIITNDTFKVLFVVYRKYCEIIKNTSNKINLTLLQYS